MCLYPFQVVPTHDTKLKSFIQTMKNAKIAEPVNFQLRLETFNTFNHGSPKADL
jgi:hypothetical protein